MHVFKLKNNRLNNRDINIDQNNRDYDFSHNRAALCHLMSDPEPSAIVLQFYQQPLLA